MEFTNYIGADESGKGDTFGPLVVAAVYITPEIEQVLIEAGVKDSKLLSDARIKELAPIILNQTSYEIRSLEPEYYNVRYSKVKNLTTIMKQMYEDVIPIMMERTQCTNIVIDKFHSSKEFIFDFAVDTDLICEPRAESYTAVAAASILARYEVVKWFELTGLSKGSGSEVRPELNTLFEKGGSEELKFFAKLHFSTVQTITTGKDQFNLF